MALCGFFTHKNKLGVMCRDVRKLKTNPLTDEIKNKEKTSFDIKAGLEFYLPSVLKLIAGDIRWTSLTKIFEDRFNDYAERYNNGERFDLRATLYSISVSAANGVETNIQFLSFIDNVFKNLVTILTENEKQHIKTNVTNLLQYDEGFLNYLGELCVLNCIMASGEYSLEKTEYKIKPDGKGIDFYFKNKKTQQDFFVEVVNIELRTDKLTDDDITTKFLTSKLQDKIADTDKSGITNYVLVPVFWGGRDDVSNTLKVKDFYERTGFNIDRVEIPRVYMQLKSAQTTYNKFGSLLKCMTLDK